MEISKTLQLHHYARRIRPKMLDSAIKIFEYLWCTVSYKPPNSNTRAMIKYPWIDTRIQFIETDNPTEETEKKRNSHIAFISQNPEKALEEIKKTIESMWLQYIQWNRSDKEFYFDCPDIFIDFVIEIMNTSVLND
jgi:hypothetical protein